MKKFNSFFEKYVYNYVHLGHKMKDSYFKNLIGLLARIVLCIDHNKLAHLPSSCVTLLTCYNFCVSLTPVGTWCIDLN